MKKWLIFAFVAIARLFREVLSRSDGSYKLLFLPGFEGARWQMGRWKAWYVFDRAKRGTPAYRQFMADRVQDLPVKGWDPDLAAITITDKESYVKKYSIEERCHGGRLPMRGAVIDESSGTSGTPNNWVRGQVERGAIRRIVQLSLHSLIGRKPVFVINAFALGPWATGMNVSMALVDVSVLKSTGPDAEKVVNTLNLFGPGYRYLLCGYPPFLKSLVDDERVDWKKFEIVAVYGGEGMSEAVRSYLGQYFTRIIGSYGASDLEINMATENDFTVALRQEIARNPALAARLTVNHGVLPMIFQYNPLDYVIETNDDGELIITLCRAANAAPKVRYNIHDLGHVVRMPEYQRIARECGIRDPALLRPLTDLPLLFHYGRSDAAVGFYGCKITPNDVQEVLYTLPETKDAVATFSLVTYEDEQHNKRLTLAVEMLAGREAPTGETLRVWETAVFERLRAVNQDFRESARMVPEGCHPTLEAYAHLTGPFADQDIRVKRKYVIAR